MAALSPAVPTLTSDTVTTTSSSECDTKSATQVSVSNNESSDSLYMHASTPFAEVVDYIAKNPQLLYQDDAKPKKSSSLVQLQPLSYPPGKYLFAAYVGSRAFNLHTPASDADLYICWAAATESVIGLCPPRLATKNSPTDPVDDFTIFEVRRTVELLATCDHRTVECLFLQNNSCIALVSPEWEKLVARRNEFLCKRLVQHYISHIETEMHRVRAEVRQHQFNSQEDPELAKVRPETLRKVCKKCYIAVRLIRLAEHAVEGKELPIWIDRGTARHNRLMKIRAQDFDYQEVLDEVGQRLDVVKAQLTESTLPEDAGHMREFLENWLIDIRRNNFSTTAAAIPPSHT
jgi:predicted nucleotidyltransferase